MRIIKLHAYQSELAIACRAFLNSSAKTAPVCASSRGFIGRNWHRGCTKCNRWWSMYSFGVLPDIFMTWSYKLTDAIFIIRQLQEKFLSRKDLNDKNLTLFFAFVDLQKAFDRVPRKVLWWAMRKVGVEEWIVRLVQAMYNNARSQVRVGCEYSEEFEVGVGVHQGSVLSPLLFIIVLEALSRDFRVGVPWELFFADDLVIIATSLEECVERVKAWKEGLESKGLHVNMTKTKFMASGLGLDILQDSGKFPCAVCRAGVGRSSIRCSKCNLWVHYKKCSGLKTLSEDLSYECPRCRGVPGIRPVDGRPFKEVEVGDCVLEAVDRFCYLGDMLSAGGGCMAAATARCRCAWGKFRENLPLLTSKPVPFDLRGRLFSSNVRSSMLHGTETWPMTSAALHRLCRNDRAMIRWICGVKPSDDPSMDELHAKLGICDLAILVRERRLRWFGHVMRSNGEIKRVRSRPVPGRKGPGRPKKTWEECVKQDLKVCGLSEAGTQDRLSWKSSVKNSPQEPTPSNGSLLQSMAAPPARRVLGMRTRSFNKTGFDWLIDWLETIADCSFRHYRQRQYFNLTLWRHNNSQFTRDVTKNARCWYWHWLGATGAKFIFTSQ